MDHQCDPSRCKPAPLMGGRRSPNNDNNKKKRRASSTDEDTDSKYPASPPPHKMSRTATGDIDVNEQCPSSFVAAFPSSVVAEKEEDAKPQAAAAKGYSTKNKKDPKKAQTSGASQKTPGWLQAEDAKDASASSKAVASVAAKKPNTRSAWRRNPENPAFAALREQEERDHALALSLQQEFNAMAFVSTSKGRAWDFVHKIGANQRRLLQYDPENPDFNAHNFKVVPTNDMVYAAARLFELQDEFRKAGKDTTVDIGFHYTTFENMHRIRTDGLLTKAERSDRKIEATTLGATFGDGIYTGNNAFAYHKFCGGDQGLFVARLKGSTDPPNPDTVLGRKGDSDEVCVLQQSAQCVALVQFHADVVSLSKDDSIGNQMAHAYHCSLQAIVDECCNGGSQTEVPKVLPSKVTKRVHASQITTALPSSKDRLNFILETQYTAPDTLLSDDHSAMLSKELLDVNVSRRSPPQCNICLESFSSEAGGPCASLAKCGHQFHRACIEESLRHSRKCPVCRNAIGSAAQGTMPSGTMKVEGCPYQDCAGDTKKSGSIKITYTMDGGIQKPYHENPGQTFEGTTRIAYLPDNEDGRKLLKRLKYAFLHGLTFTIGTSLSTGRPNMITWASIHHKTSTSEGPYGYPDPGYFINANEELDALNVPPSADL